MGDGAASGFFAEPENVFGGSSPDDIFSILGNLENQFPILVEEEGRGGADACRFGPTGRRGRLLSQRSTSSLSALPESETELEGSPVSSKRPRVGAAAKSADEEGPPRMTHITVERNRRKQMNDHLTVLRSLMPSFYVKRGDQASIIGGVVEYINELQQVLQSLEAKKQRKVYSEVLSPRVQASCSPRLAISPRVPPPLGLGSLPISPRTPQPPSSPYPKPPLAGGYISPSLPSPTAAASSASSTAVDAMNELVANSRSEAAEVEVKFTGANVVLKTVSRRIPRQTLKIVSALEDLSLQILQVNVSAVDEATVVNSITIKIGVECQLSAEELAHRIQQTFSG